MAKQKLLKSNLAAAAFLLAGAVTLPGCDFVAGLTRFSCVMSGDPVHCMQDAAVQSGNPDECNNVAQKEEFRSMGSNPPRDKCVMMTAMNSEDPSMCSKVKGGAMSYSKEDCEQSVAENATKPSTCEQLSGSIGSTCADKVTEQTTAEVSALLNKPDMTEADIQAAQKKMDDISKLESLMSDLARSQYVMQKTAISNLR